LHSTLERVNLPYGDKVQTLSQEASMESRVTFRQSAAQEGERAAAVTFSYASTQKRPR
jgi:hypothetical protein